MRKSSSLSSPVYSTNGLGFEEPMTNSTAVIQEWKNLRAQLTDTIQKYLVACVNLNVLCAQPQELSSDRLAIESALVSVDLQLSHMALEEEKLRAARVSLMETRNRYSTLAPINKLPPEILSHIFILSKGYCLEDDRQRKTSSGIFLDVFSEVCTYWRRVALDTPTLWTHIDISPHADRNQRSQSADILLRRSQSLPVHLHVIESERILKSPNEAAASQLAKFLAPHMTRVGSLFLSTDSYSRKFIRHVLRLWMTKSRPGSSHTLSICRPSGSMFFNISEEILLSSKFGSRQQTEDILSSLRVLHLHNAGLRWSSAAYSGLIDLQIHSSTEPVRVSTLEMASVLSSSPGLVTLKLGNVILYIPDDSEKPSSVNLDYLEVLGLTYMHLNSLCLLLPLISPPKRNKNLSLGITVNKEFILTPELESFFDRAHVTTLCTKDRNSRSTIGHILQLLPLLPSLDTLGATTYSLEGLLPSTSSVADPSETSAPPALPSHFHIPRFHLTYCSVDLEGLSYLVSTYRIQYLRLEGCQSLIKPNSNPEQKTDFQKDVVAGYRDSLCQTFPDLECVVSKVDTVQYWPCRTTLPCALPDE